MTSYLKQFLLEQTPVFRAVNGQKVLIFHLKQKMANFLEVVAYLGAFVVWEVADGYQDLASVFLSLIWHTNDSAGRAVLWSSSFDVVTVKVKGGGLSDGFSTCLNALQLLYLKIDILFCFVNDVVLEH